VIRNLSPPNTSPPSTYINSSSTILTSPKTCSSAYSRTHTHTPMSFIPLSNTPDPLRKHNHLHKCELSRTVCTYTFLVISPHYPNSNVVSLPIRLALMIGHQLGSFETRVILLEDASERVGEFDGRITLHSCLIYHHPAFTSPKWY
jgi:hypothetical protein